MVLFLFLFIFHFFPLVDHSLPLLPSLFFNIFIYFFIFYFLFIYLFLSRFSINIFTKMYNKTWNRSLKYVKRTQVYMKLACLGVWFRDRFRTWYTAKYCGSTPTKHNQTIFTHSRKNCKVNLFLYPSFLSLNSSAERISGVECILGF